MTLKHIVWAGLIGVSLVCGSVVLVGHQLDQERGSAQRQRDDALLRAAQTQVERTLSDDLRLRASLLAADGASIAYIADSLQVGATPGQTVDSASISDLLADRREQLGLDAVGVIDVSGRWIAGTRPWSDGGPVPLRHPLFVAARDGQKLAMGLVREDRRLYLAAIQPMVRASTVDAYLYAASALDERFLKTVGTLVSMDLALLATAEPAQLLAQSTELGEQAWAGVMRATSSGAVGAPTDIATGETRMTRLPLFAHGDQAVLLAQPLSDSGGSGLLSSSLALLAALWSLAWLLVLYLVWRASVQPAKLACDLLERAALGDFKLRAPPWPSGLRGRFAAAFDTLMLRLGSR